MSDYLCFACNPYVNTRRFCPGATENTGSNQVSNITFYQGLSFNNFVQDFLLKSNIYLIDCATSHSTLNTLDNIMNQSKFLEKRYTKYSEEFWEYQF